MSIENRRLKLENTRLKLLELEQLYATTSLSSTRSNDPIRELTLRSLKKRINQFREEIARFEARVRQVTPNG